MADQIQANYETLTQIQKQFEELEEKSKTLRGRVVVAYHEIKDGRGWEGEGSKAFIQEMDNFVLTWLNNLTTAMNAAGISMGNIATKFREAEETIQSSSPERTASGG
jgi:WXG100 family type VII secretion target